MTEADRNLLDAAYEQALKSLRTGGIPIGSALGTADGMIVAAGHNLRMQEGDSTAHAEIVCLRNAGRRRDWHTLTLASTLSPCIMCTGATLLHRVPRVIVGENRTFVGAEALMAKHGVQVILANDARCIALMEQFIRDRPDVWNEDIGIPPGSKTSPEPTRAG